MRELLAKHRFCFPFSEPRRDYSFFNGPRVRGPDKSSAESVLGYARMSGQFRESKVFSLVIENYVRNAVVGLFGFRGPSTIAGFIVPVVIRKAVKRATFRHLSHIFKEAFKTTLAILSIAPSVAHRYPTPLIVLKGWIRWLAASCDSITPRRVCFADSPGCCVPVNASLTAAGMRSSIPQCCEQNLTFCSANASTEPNATFTFTRPFLNKTEILNRGPITKHLARNVFDFRHVYYSTW